MDSINQKSLLSLNDKCLQTLFEYLSLGERKSLVEIDGLRFDPIIRRSFNGRSVCISNRDSSFIENYGRSLTKVYTRDISVGVLELMARYCTEGNLRSMYISHRISNDEFNTISGSILMLSHLKTLFLSNCDDSHLGRILAVCPELEELKIWRNSSDTLAPLLRISSKNMKTLILKCHLFNQRNTFVQILAKTPNLRTLQLDTLGTPTSIPVENIANSLPNLESLVISTSFKCNGFGYLAGLKHLKRLSICFREDNLTEFIDYLEAAAVQNTLEELLIFNQWNMEYDNDTFDALINAICECKTIRKLTFRFMPIRLNGIETAVKLAENLPLLQQFCVVSYDGPDVFFPQLWQWKETLEFIQKAKKLQVLNLIALDNFDIERYAKDFQEAIFFENVGRIVERRERNEQKLAINMYYVKKYSFFGCRKLAGSLYLEHFF